MACGEVQVVIKYDGCFGNLVVNCDENEFQQLVTVVETETRKHIKSDTDTDAIFSEHPGRFI
ncbi:MAG: hypothetical protein IPG39_19530 [Bacteroidetes bacterium]|nr:hypothetical protein [Bacteroidota bacterium]